MELGPGTTLLHYRLVEKLGEGGMGVVWKADDGKLDRHVAIKVLPDTFSADPERLARFEREAKLLAALTHPNIAAIHGLEEHDGVRFLVMELVPGQDLAERLANGPLDSVDALAVCRQIAEALEAAHERGIIHRDLKPANVKITPDGKVKVLDFGLAKALETTPSVSDPSLSPTVTSVGTRAGEILGTAAYMSPEQARGLPLDKRTDIWSFGCVLYETITGIPPFRRATIPDTLAAVLERDPDWSALPQATSPAVTKLIRRCLEKQPHRRLRDIGDAGLDIDDSITGTLQTVTSPLPAIRRGVPYSIALLALLLGVAIGTFLVPKWTSSSPVTTSRTTRLSFTLPTSVTIDVGQRPALALSPDGRLVAFAGRHGDTRRLYLRPLDADQALEIPDTAGADAPFFSPDSNWIGFLRGNMLWKVPVAGGVPSRIASVPPVARGFSWARPNEIVFSPSKVYGMWCTPADGGPSDILSLPNTEAGELNHCWPQALPGGAEVLVTALMQGDDSYDDANLLVIDTDTGSVRTVVEGGYHGRLLRGGILAFVRAGKLWAAPVDPRTLEPLQPAVAVLDGFLTDPGTGAASFAVSTDGSLAYVPGGIDEWQRGRLVWVDRQGRVERVSDEVRSFRYPRVSPDGERLAFTIEEASDDVWLYDPARGGFTRLTFENRDIAPIWRPGHDELSFTVVGAGRTPRLHIMPADGSDEPRLLVPGAGPAFNGSWSPDGETLLYMQWRPETEFDIFVVSDGGAGTPIPLHESRFNERMPKFSPDGNWIAYSSDESGRMEVYVQPYPGPGAKWKISTDGGGEPTWNPQGGEIFYRDGDRLMSVRVELGHEFRASRPQLLFEGQYAQRTLDWLTNYDVARDGSRFLMIQEDDRPEIREIRIVQNWLTEVEDMLIEARR